MKGDGALGWKANFPPETLGNERSGNPVHRKAKVVKLPQMDIGADRARSKAGQKLGFYCYRPVNLNGHLQKLDLRVVQRIDQTHLVGGVQVYHQRIGNDQNVDGPQTPVEPPTLVEVWSTRLHPSRWLTAYAREALVRPISKP